MVSIAGFMSSPFFSIYAATKAAQVDSIASDAAKVQALIAAFGDVPTEIFTTNEDKVIAAREAFDAWVAKYEKCFFAKNGYQFVRDAKGNIVTDAEIDEKVWENEVADDSNITASSVIILHTFSPFCKEMQNAKFKMQN